MIGTGPNEPIIVIGLIAALFLAAAAVIGSQQKHTANENARLDARPPRDETTLDDHYRSAVIAAFGVPTEELEPDL